jgi:hypothetical protein
MTIYTDAGELVLKLTPASVSSDEGTVRLNLTPSGTEFRVRPTPSFQVSSTRKWAVIKAPSPHFFIEPTSQKKYLVSYFGKAPNVPSS